MKPIWTGCWGSPMSDKVDALFDGEPTPPPEAAGPRIQTLRRTLTIAIALDVLGIPCWTSVPGALLTLWVWLSTDTDIARIEAGAYRDEDAATILQLRQWATWALVLCVGCLVIQIALLTTSFYERFWGSLTIAMQHLANGMN